MHNQIQRKLPLPTLRHSIGNNFHSSSWSYPVVQYSSILSHPYRNISHFSRSYLPPFRDAYLFHRCAIVPVGHPIQLEFITPLLESWIGKWIPLFPNSTRSLHVHPWLLIRWRIRSPSHPSLTVLLQVPYPTLCGSPFHLHQRYLMVTPLHALQGNPGVILRPPQVPHARHSMVIPSSWSSLSQRHP